MIIQTVKFLVAALLMLIPCITFAKPLPGPHDPVTGATSIVCTSCHVSGNNIANSDTKYASNLCLKCHVSGNATLTTKHFSKDDFSNLFDNAGVVVQSSNKNQTSHKWFGSDTVPGAGAVPPIDPRGNAGLNKTGFTGSLTCARCHSVHGTSGLDSNNYPYLRMSNDSDQLCLACHRTRSVQDHKLGSHPVNVTYTSASVKAKIADPDHTTSFLPTQITNINNPTGEVKLKNGKIVCSTCHGVHNADSNTDTVDTFGIATSADGYLLRVSRKGATVTDVNICTNCHMSKGHNLNSRGGYAPLQCVDCHSAHVEYDPAAAGKPAELVPNVNLVSRYLTYSSAARSSKRILYRSTTIKEYYNTTGNGVCQVCHKDTIPADHYTGNVKTGVFPEAGHTGCSQCHSHAESKGSFAYGLNGACSTSCHGLPPTSNYTAGPDGFAAGYTRFDESITPHISHSAAGGPNANVFECEACHSGYIMGDNNFSQVFVTTSTLAGSTAKYINGRCDTVYCHSNGRGSWNTTYMDMGSIPWNDRNSTKIIGNANECKICHNDPNDSVGHAWHAVERQYGCVTCHSLTVSNDTTLLTLAKTVGGSHLNRTADIKFSGLGAAIGTSCANVQCHSNGKGAAPFITPSWAIRSTGDCGACHLVGTATFVTTAILSTGSHTIHFNMSEINGGLTGADGTLYSAVVCAKCHTYVSEKDMKHVDGILDITTPTPTASCGVCHASPYSQVPSTPAWGTHSNGCGSCHTGVGAFTGTGLSPNTGSHTKHMFLGYACNACHTNAVAGSTGGTGHLDGNIDVIGGYPVDVAKHDAGSGYNLCNNAICHVSPYSATSLPSPAWGSASQGCVTCHSGVGAFTGNGGAPNTGSHNKHLNIAATTCNACHTGAVVASTGGSAHLDTNIDVAASLGYTANVTKHTAGSVYRTCATAGNSSCHISPYSASAVTTPSWGTAAGCISCHSGAGTFSGTGSAPFTGSHNKHMAISGTNCSNCHSGTIVNVTGGPTTVHIDGNIDVVGYSTANVAKHIYGSGYGTCSNTTCHANPYGTAPIKSPTWGVSAGCVSCHSGVGEFTGTGTAPTTGSHTKHIAALATCGTCHLNAVGGLSGGATHADGYVDVLGGYPLAVTKHTSGSNYKTCSTSGNAGCHMDPYGFGAVKTPTWGIGAGCVSCHTGAGAFTGAGTGPTTGSHSKHMAVTGTLCNQCHAGVIAGVTGGGVTHIDGNIDVVGYSVANVTKHTENIGFTCANASCHKSPYSTTATVASPSWGVAAGCVACHTGQGAFTGSGSAPVTGSHTRHLVIAGTACGTCHTGAIVNVTGGPSTAHNDGNVDVVATLGYPANITRHAYASGYNTCASASNTACHVSPYSASATTTPTWGASGGCVSCHNLVGAFTGTGTSPTTGSHTKHIAASATCASCHTGAIAGITGGGATHIDGNVDVIGGYKLNVTKHTAGTYTGTCSTTTCHGSYSATWGVTTGNDYCTRCHGTGTVTINSANRQLVAPNLGVLTGTGQVSNDLKTGAHRTHLLFTNGFSNYSTIDYRCESCHGLLPLANTYGHADTNSSPVGKYKNIANKWNAMGGQTYASQTCTNTYCHNPAGTNGSLNTANTGTGTTPVWTNAAYIADGTQKTAANCNQCHKVPGAPGFNSGFAHTALTDNTYVVTQDCTGCHGHNGDTQGTVGFRHIDGIKSASGGTACNGCHGYPPLTAAERAAHPLPQFADTPVDKQTLNSSHHASHLLSSIVIGNGSTPCLPCHPFAGLHMQGGSTVIRANIQVNESTDMGYRFDANRSKRYNPTSKTCSNISCHFQPTTAW